MEWHYTRDGEAVGPVAEDEIRVLITQGTLNAESMVWNSTFEEWKPLSETELAAMLSAPSAEAALDLNTDKCSVCGNNFQNDELVDIGGSKSCAECKPVALRRFQENSMVSPEMDYAGFWIRVVSTIIDGFVMLPVYILIIYLFSGSLFMPGNGSGLLMAKFLQYAVSFLYTTLLIWKYGGTLGLKTMGLKVVNADGSDISYLKSVGRYFAFILSGSILLIGFIIVAFDREKRALHDMICGTRVIYK
jgi:uncharacterized RDD family membrane protein YckC